MISFRVTGWPHPEVEDVAALLSRYTDYAGVIGAALVTSGEIRELNRVYAGKDRSTDVLSFSYIESSGSASEAPADSDRPSGELGDILISREHARQQAEAAGTDEDTERLLLLTHGSLHILGFDHQTKAQQKRMDAVQGDIMGELGRVYRDFGWRD
ncbi:rRNA maturation RNase YbeY [Candidatus Saccharibacteria bacterium QS_5_54_17]|nr:MAG: rRNA maturation RNase YbeY [Candidatus Saccharibacteria bacterium QS_5_54_17]